MGVVRPPPAAAAAGSCSLGNDFRSRGGGEPALAAYICLAAAAIPAGTIRSVRTAVMKMGIVLGPQLH